MYRFAAAALLLAVGLPAWAQDNLVAKTQGGDQDAKEKFQFTVIKENPATSVKDQASSSTCWAYSGLSFVESEMIRLGKKPADLAEMFVVYKVYQEKARKYVRQMCIRDRNNLVQQGHSRVKVLKTEEQWYGVTYPEDRPCVIRAIENLIEKGVYPTPLW